MRKKIMFKCDFCGEMVTRNNIYKFKRSRFYPLRGVWVKERFDICHNCKAHIGMILYKKRKERGEEVF